MEQRWFAESELADAKRALARKLIGQQRRLDRAGQIIHTLVVGWFA